MRTPIRYARSGDLRIAYQVVGEGPIDLLFVPGFISNLEHSWEDPQFAALLDRLASFSRLILFDKRGTGLSDRIGDLPSLEVRMDDVRAVLDTVGSQRAAIFGTSEGGAMAMLFAATYPERVRALALYSTYAHYPTWVVPDDQLDGMIERMDRLWGTGELSPAFAPSRAADPRFREWWARFERLGGSPSVATRITRMNSEIDIRHILPSIRIPTLILHRAGDARVSVEAGRYLAREIPDARYVELPGQDHLLWAGDTMRVAEEIQEFLTGARHEVEEWDRVLATVLFTDIVDSTLHASRLGDTPGASFWPPITPSCDARSGASADGRSRRRATASSPSSTGRHARCAAGRRSRRRSSSSRSRCGSAFIRARSTSGRTISAA